MVGLVLDFCLWVLHRPGQDKIKVSTVEQYRGTLAAVFPVDGVESLSLHPDVQSFFAGLHRQNPSLLPREWQAFDPEVVWTFLVTELADNSTLPYSQLVGKFVILLQLHSKLRAGESVKIVASTVSVTADTLHFSVFRLKTFKSTGQHELQKDWVTFSISRIKDTPAMDVGLVAQELQLRLSSSSAELVSGLTINGSLSPGAAFLRKLPSLPINLLDQTARSWARGLLRKAGIPDMFKGHDIIHAVTTAEKIMGKSDDEICRLRWCSSSTMRQRYLGSTAVGLWRPEGFIHWRDRPAVLQTSTLVPTN